MFVTLIIHAVNGTHNVKIRVVTLSNLLVLLIIKVGKPILIVTQLNNIQVLNVNFGIIKLWIFN